MKLHLCGVWTFAPYGRTLMELKTNKGEKWENQDVRMK